MTSPREIKQRKGTATGIPFSFLLFLSLSPCFACDFLLCFDIRSAAAAAVEGQRERQTQQDRIARGATPTIGSSCG